jgi:hypothetical protein
MPAGIARNPVRYDVEMPARYRGQGNPNWNDGLLANLSVGGLCLVAPEADLLPGQAIEIVIETTDKYLRVVPRRIPARVVWSRGGRHGVEFTKRATGDPFAPVSGGARKRPAARR